MPPPPFSQGVADCQSRSVPNVALSSPHGAAIECFWGCLSQLTPFKCIAGGRGGEGADGRGRHDQQVDTTGMPMACGLTLGVLGLHTCGEAPKHGSCECLSVIVCRGTRASCNNAGVKNNCTVCGGVRGRVFPGRSLGCLFSGRDYRGLWALGSQAKTHPQSGGGRGGWQGFITIAMPRCPTLKEVWLLKHCRIGVADVGRRHGYIPLTGFGSPRAGELGSQNLHLFGSFVLAKLILQRVWAPQIILLLCCCSWWCSCGTVTERSFPLQTLPFSR